MSFPKNDFFENCNLEVIKFAENDVITTSGPVDGFKVEDGGYFDESGNFISD